MTDTGTSAAVSLGPPRWRGEPGRTEVWYATLTDATGTGIWIHCETVAPTAGPHHAHGWIAVFPRETAPILERFGPGPVDAGAHWFRCGDVEVADGRLRGRTESVAWDLTFGDDAPPLYTFPKAVWDRTLLPGAQVVPWPTARFSGSLEVGATAWTVAAHGAVARIYGHGNAQRWGWLHAPLGGDGVLEIVTATARRRSMRRLPPLAMVQLRLPGEDDWPRNPALACVRFRTRLRDDGFSVRGGAGGRRLHVDVTLPVEARVALTYTDPDGATATCTNSARASASITVESRADARQWKLDGTAHAEVGSRP